MPRAQYVQGIICKAIAAIFAAFTMAAPSTTAPIQVKRRRYPGSSPGAGALRNDPCCLPTWLPGGHINLDKTAAAGAGNGII
jgi:hypothetical protein